MQAQASQPQVTESSIERFFRRIPQIRVTPEEITRVRTQVQTISRFLTSFDADMRDHLVQYENATILNKDSPHEILLLNAEQLLFLIFEQGQVEEAPGKGFEEKLTNAIKLVKDCITTLSDIQACSEVRKKGARQQAQKKSLRLEKWLEVLEKLKLVVAATAKKKEKEDEETAEEDPEPVAVEKEKCTFYI